MATLIEPKQGGFTLPEVLLAMMLGTVLMLTVSSLLPGMGASINLLQSSLRLQQNVRTAGLLIERALSRSNFTGCLPDKSFTSDALQHFYGAKLGKDWGKDSLLERRRNQRVPDTGAMALSYALPPAIPAVVPTAKKNGLLWIEVKPEGYKTGDSFLLTNCTQGVLVQPGMLSYSSGGYLLEGVSPSLVLGWKSPLYAYLWVEMGYMVRGTTRKDPQGETVPALYLIRDGRSAVEVVESVSALDFQLGSQKLQVRLGTGPEDARQLWGLLLPWQ